MKRIHFISVLIAGLLMTGWSSLDKETPIRITRSEGSRQAPSSAEVKLAGYCRAIAEMNGYELKIVQLIAERSENTLFISIAKRMEAEYEKTRNELIAFASSRSIPMPVLLSKQKEKKLEEMKIWPDNVFEKKLLSALRASHKESGKLLHDVSSGVSDEQFRILVKKMSIHILISQRLVRAYTSQLNSFCQ